MTNMKSLLEVLDLIGLKPQNNNGSLTPDLSRGLHKAFDHRALAQIYLWMKLHFANKQEFQLEALKTITDIFEGQTLSNSCFEFSISQAHCLTKTFS